MWCGAFIIKWPAGRRPVASNSNCLDRRPAGSRNQFAGDAAVCRVFAQVQVRKRLMMKPDGTLLNFPLSSPLSRSGAGAVAGAESGAEAEAMDLAGARGGVRLEWMTSRPAIIWPSRRRRRQVIGAASGRYGGCKQSAGRGNCCAA